MRRFLITIAAVAVMASTVYAADQIVVDLGGTPVTITVNATNKALLTALKNRENVRIAAQTPPGTALSAEEYTRDLIVALLQNYKQQLGTLDRQDACTRFNALSPAQQATVIAKAEWGGFSPCP